MCRAAITRHTILDLKLAFYQHNIYILFVTVTTVTMMNGQMNGFHNSLIEEDCFLFTSESVGEGHPGKSRHDAGLLS